MGEMLDKVPKRHYHSPLKCNISFQNDFPQKPWDWKSCFISCRDAVRKDKKSWNSRQNRESLQVFNRLVWFEDFSDISYEYVYPTIKQCLLPIPIATSFAILEQPTVILSFVFASEAGRARCVVICINLTPAQLKWLTEQKNPKSL